MNADLQESHIIPEFLYRPLYDKIHRYRVIPTELAKPELLLQKGIRESLLCRTCEQHIGRWENYTKTAFVDGKGITTVQHEGAVILSGLDYAKLKLFQLSLFWRMSVTCLDYFKEVDLGIHEEKIRLALIRDDPLLPDEFACRMSAIAINGQPHFDWITSPCIEKLDGCLIFWLIINGIMYCFHVGSHPTTIGAGSLHLNANGVLVIPLYELAEIPCLLNTAQLLIRARKLRI